MTQNSEFDINFTTILNYTAVNRLDMNVVMKSRSTKTLSKFYYININIITQKSEFDINFTTILNYTAVNRLDVNVLINIFNMI